MKSPYRLPDPEGERPPPSGAPTAPGAEIEDLAVLLLVLVVGAVGVGVGFVTHRPIEPAIGAFMMLWAVRAGISQRRDRPS